MKKHKMNTQFLPLLSVLLAATLLGGCASWDADGNIANMVTLADVQASFLRQDDAQEFKRSIERGLPIHNYYSAFGNSERMTASKECFVPDTPLLLAALRMGATKCASLLMDLQVDVSKVSGVGDNALMMAAGLPEDETVGVVSRVVSLHAFDVNATNDAGRTALEMAIEGNNGRYVSWLLKHGADPSVRSRYRFALVFGFRRPVFFEALNARRDIFDEVLALPTVDILAKDSRGSGILRYLEPGLHDYESRFLALIDKGAPLDAVDTEEVLTRNMRVRGDDGARVRLICSHVREGTSLKKVLAYAKKRNLRECVRVLEDFEKRLCPPMRFVEAT